MSKSVLEIKFYEWFNSPGVTEANEEINTPRDALEAAFYAGALAGVEIIQTGVVDSDE